MTAQLGGFIGHLNALHLGLWRNPSVGAAVFIRVIWSHSVQFHGQTIRSRQRSGRMLIHSRHLGCRITTGQRNRASSTTVSAFGFFSLEPLPVCASGPCWTALRAALIHALVHYRLTQLGQH